jgi:RNAse (barnase) inhibitor barstar
MNVEKVLAKKLAEIFGYPFRVEHNGEWLIADLSEVERDRFYLDGVRHAMTLDDPLSELRRLWEYDDLLKPVEAIMFALDVNRGERHMLVMTPHALYRRFRGLIHAICDEISPNMDNLWDILKDERLKRRFPITAKIINLGNELAEKKRKETGIEVHFTVDIKVSQEVPYPSNYTIPVMNFEGTLPISEEFEEEVVGQVKPVKEVWAEWVNERKRLCQEMGMDEVILAVRDIIEAQFDLPVWSVEAKPGRLGSEVVVDPEYIDLWKSNLSKSDPEKASMLDDLLFQVEFLKTQGLVRVYSSPIFLYYFISRIILEELGIYGEVGLDEVPRGREIIRSLLRRPRELKANLLNYFTNPENLKDIGSISPLLAMRLENLITYLEKRRDGVENTTLHPILYITNPKCIKRVNPEDFVCEGDDAIEFDTKTTCAVRLDFKDPKGSEVIKFIPSWLSQCLTAYKEIKRIMLREYK